MKIAMYIIVALLLVGAAPIQAPTAFVTITNPPAMITISDSTISFMTGGATRIKIDKNGMYFNGKLVKDAGEAHAAMMDYLRYIHATTGCK